MLEIILVKGAHAGKDAAQDLLPLLETADVVSLENADLLERTAQRLERELIKNYIASPTFEEFFKCVHDSDPAAQQGDFLQQIFSTLYVHKTPLWFTERLSVSKQREQRERYALKNVSYSDALDALLDSDLTSFYYCAQREYEATMAAVTFRDQEIARNLQRAENVLFERYPEISTKKHPRFVVQIGLMHKPEEFIDVPVQVIESPFTPQDTIADKHTQYVLHAKEFKELKYVALQYAAVALSKLDKSPFSEQEILAMSFDELVRYYS